MKRKVLSLLLVIAMGMTLLVGCGGANDTKENKEEVINEEVTEAETTEEVVEETEAVINLASEFLV